MAMSIKLTYKKHMKINSIIKLVISSKNSKIINLAIAINKLVHIFPWGGTEKLQYKIIVIRKCLLTRIGVYLNI